MRKNSLIFRALLLCLALVLATVTLFGCNDDPNDGDVTTGDSSESGGPSGGGENSDLYDKDGYLKDSLPDDLDLDATVDILYWSDVSITEFEVLFESGDTVSDAVFRRNNRVESRLNVTLAWHGMEGHWQAGDDFSNAVMNSVNSNLNAYDIVAGYSQTAANLAISGYSLPLNDVKYLDLEKPWWPSDLTGNFTVGEDIYFLSGDISTTLLTEMLVVYFNKAILTTYGITDSMYDLVENNQWTVDKLMEITKDISSDTDPIGTKDRTDTYGILCPYPYVDAFLYGSNITSITKNDEGRFVVSNDFCGEKAETLASKLITMFARDSGGISSWNDRDSENRHWPSDFGNGYSAFIVSPAGEAMTEFNKSSVKYGILPIPKYDTTQKDYHTTGSNGISLYMISKDCSKADADNAGAVLECMGSEGYRVITPEVYETCMKVRYSKDSKDGQMYDLLRSGMLFDLGRVLGRGQLNEYTQNYWRGSVDGESNKTWGSQYPSIKTNLQALLDSVLNSSLEGGG